MIEPPLCQQLCLLELKLPPSHPTQPSQPRKPLRGLLPLMALWWTGGSGESDGSDGYSDHGGLDVQYTNINTQIQMIKKGMSWMMRLRLKRSSWIIIKQCNKCHGVDHLTFIKYLPTPAHDDEHNEIRSKKKKQWLIEQFLYLRWPEGL